jgi:guanylate kinase
MENKIKILALIGNTASGKSTLQDNLIKEFPDKYEAVGQFTTRHKRSKEESNLIYITEEQYNTIKSNLVGKCSFNNNYYGSLLCNLDNDKIKIVTVTIEGYIDLLNNVEDLNNIYTLILLSNNFTDALSIRKNRSLEFLEQEYNEIKDYVYSMGNMKDRGYFIMNLKPKEYPKLELVDSLCSKYFSREEYKDKLLYRINKYIKELGEDYFCSELSNFMNDYSPNSKLFSFNLLEFVYEDENGVDCGVWYQDLDIGELEKICDILENEYHSQIKTIERCKD